MNLPADIPIVFEASFVVHVMARNREVAAEIDDGTLVHIAAILARAGRNRRHVLRLAIDELARRGALPRSDDLRVAWDSALAQGRVAEGDDARLTLVEAWARSVWLHAPLRWPELPKPREDQLLYYEIVDRINATSIPGVTASARDGSVVVEGGLAWSARGGLERAVIEVRQLMSESEPAADAPRTPPVGPGLMRRLSRGRPR